MYNICVLSIFPFMKDDCSWNIVMHPIWLVGSTQQGKIVANIRQQIHLRTEFCAEYQIILVGQHLLLFGASLRFVNYLQALWTVQHLFSQKLSNLTGDSSLNGVVVIFRRIAQKITIGKIETKSYIHTYIHFPIRINRGLKLHSAILFFVSLCQRWRERIQVKIFIYMKAQLHYRS